MLTRFSVAGLAFVGSLVLATSQSAALTIEQAEELSQRTGRPILAVAGSKT